MLNEGMMVSHEEGLEDEDDVLADGHGRTRRLEAPGERESLREVLAELEEEAGEQEDGRAALDGLDEVLKLVTTHEEDREKDDDGHTREQGYEVLLLHASPGAISSLQLYSSKIEKGRGAYA